MNEIYNKLLDLIFNSVIAEGGDGDAIWLAKYISLENLIKLIEKYNKENNTQWEIINNSNHLLWGINQEWAIITNNEEFFNSQPNWITLRIKY